MSPSHSARRLGVALLITTAVLVGWFAPPAGAHGDEGTMEIISAESTSPLEIDLEVGIVYTNDDDPAPDATVTVTATGADGASVGPIDVPNRNDGVYATTFSVPSAGTWSLAVTATEPAAEATGTVEVPDATTTTTPGTETTEAPTTTTGDAPTTTAASGSSSSPASTDSPSTTPTDAESDSDDDDSNVLPLVLVALLAVAAIVAVVVLARRSAAGPVDDDTPTDAPAGTGPGDPTVEEPGPEQGGDGR